MMVPGQTSIDGEAPQKTLPLLPPTGEGQRVWKVCIEKGVLKDIGILSHKGPSRLKPAL